jgi:hypothetical protein
MSRVSFNLAPPAAAPVQELLQEVLVGCRHIGPALYLERDMRSARTIGPASFAHSGWTGLIADRFGTPHHG